MNRNHGNFVVLRSSKSATYVFSTLQKCFVGHLDIKSEWFAVWQKSKGTYELLERLSTAGLEIDSSMSIPEGFELKYKHKNSDWNFMFQPLF